MPAHKIDFYLNSSNSLRQLADEARRIAELQQVFLNVAPQPLTLACSVRQLRAGTLVLLAENAAIAAKIKQLFPRLLTDYQKLGWQVTSIKVEVQVSESVQQPAAGRARTRLSIETIDNLERLAAGLEDSPLKQALARLVAHQRDGS
ncbi:MAG: DciA family protein [Pseudomonadota bacterium]